MDRRCIAICDSGIGGLRLLKRLDESVKGQTLLYYADFDNLPYGNKSVEELNGIAENILKRFLPFCPKAVVFACNTLSVNTIGKDLNCGVEIVRVLPKVRANEKGLLLCTEATAKSEYVKALQKENKLLDVMALSGLAEEVEAHVFCNKEIDLKSRFKGVERDYDFVSLGCTHYPWMVKELVKIFPNSQFLSGESEAFEKIVFSVTTFDTLDHRNEICFIGRGVERLKSLYLKGFL